MIAQYRPDIARVAEETVVNLKELENRLEIMKNELAWLCTSIGHPEAARLAATPVRAAYNNPYALSIGATSALGGLYSLPQVPGVSPLAAQFGLVNPVAAALAAQQALAGIPVFPGLGNFGAYGTTLPLTPGWGTVFGTGIPPQQQLPITFR